jgi:hypothetical protein
VWLQAEFVGLSLGCTRTDDDFCGGRNSAN